jgi:hypothetical protein
VTREELAATLDRLRALPLDQVEESTLEGMCRILGAAADVLRLGETYRLGGLEPDKAVALAVSTVLRRAGAAGTMGGDDAAA